MKNFLLMVSVLVFSSLGAIPPPDTLVIATKLDSLISLDPAEMFESSGLEYAFNTYDRLIRYDPDNEGEFQGSLADRWTTSDDGKTVTFHLRKDVSFASGNPATAEDAAFSLQRIVQLNRSPAYLFAQFGWTSDNVADKVRAIDASTLVLKTDGVATSLLLYCLATANASIVEKGLVLSHEDKGDLGNSWMKTHYAGSGPYTLQWWIANTGLYLTSNENYFGGAAKIKKVILRAIPEESSQKILLMKGDVDIARNLGLDQVEGVEDLHIDIYPLSMTYFMSMNQKHPQLKIPQVRQALKYLIDYENLEGITGGKMTVHQSFIPKGFFGAYENNPFAYDLDKAKALLREADLEEGFAVNLHTSNATIGEAIQAMFAKANIRVNILLGDSKQVLTKLRAREHDLCLSTWVPDYHDPHNNAITFAYNPNNADDSPEKTLAWRNCWQSAEMNEMTLAAMKEHDQEKRRALYVQLQQYFHDNAPFANLFQENRVLVQRKEALDKEVHLMSPLDVLCYYTPEKK